jgi:serine/threonine-protein kinase RIO1
MAGKVGKGNLFLLPVYDLCSYRPAPKLKDMEIEEPEAQRLYVQCIKMMRKLYHECHLVHADLSEFNIL